MSSLLLRVTIDGSAIAALAEDPAIVEKSGRVLDVLELAQHYGFSEPEGPRPAC